MASIDQIRKLREETGVSVSECKKALVAANGDLAKAKATLRKWGQEISGKKIERETREGIIESYIHPNKKIGVLLDLRCESDFVARAEEFKKLAHELCLQIAAMGPLFLNTEEIPEKFLAGERKTYQEQFKEAGKSKKTIDEIVEGKLKKYKEEISLMSQPWIRDETRTIKELIDEYITRLGENIIIKRFARFEI